MRNSALEFRRVLKSYRSTKVLDGLHLTVARGEFFALVGINGAGKTTAIKTLLDFTSLDEGEISLFGNPHGHKSARRLLAYLPERFTPPEFLSGRGFLRYIANLHGVAFSEPGCRSVYEALDLQWSSFDQPVARLSKGMTQKLGIAGCFLSGKPLFILDEPMSGLDPKARVLVKRRLLSLKSSRQTLFFSTHMLADVVELCDRFGILHEGRLRYLGSPQDCMEEFQAKTLEQAYLNCITAGIG